MEIDSGMTLTTKEDIAYIWREEAKRVGLGYISNVSPNTFRLKDIEDNYQDYKCHSMKILTGICDFKCCREYGISEEVCANQWMINSPMVDVDNEFILELYRTKYTFCHSIVFGGLEPLKQMDELYHLCKYLRDNKVSDPIVIYTGYYPHELNPHDMLLLISLEKVIIKFGRYIPNSDSRYDEVLGVNLISNNQYAVEF